MGFLRDAWSYRSLVIIIILTPLLLLPLPLLVGTKTEKLLFVRVNPERLMLGFMVSSAFLSMWVNNMSATAMVMPIVEAVIQQIVNAESEITSQQEKAADRLLQRRSAVGRCRGFSVWVANLLIPLGKLPVWAVITITCGIVTTFTEVASNPATVTVFSPILSPMVCSPRPFFLHYYD
ncbi:hypothetical protein SKAU_G00024540 [Synaphobranchus kaupii]|uniref:Solute carrier family 13 member 2 n=1 Tax=Synaphobranchus kaupii TaxID=118154 RepID=A0A9Q1GCF6_SYNKA|nr:hypothetical protein SKAU_G00024540 [Synaphobranchus kaupii]